MWCFFSDDVVARKKNKKKKRKTRTMDKSSGDSDSQIGATAVNNDHGHEEESKEDEMAEECDAVISANSLHAEVSQRCSSCLGDTKCD